MSTQSKKEKVMLRQAVPVAPARPEEVLPQPPSEAASPQPAEPIAQFEDNLGDRVAYVIWLIGAAVLLLHFLGDTIVGLLF